MLGKLQIILLTQVTKRISFFFAILQYIPHIQPLHLSRYFQSVSGYFLESGPGPWQTKLSWTWSSCTISVPFKVSFYFISAITEVGTENANLLRDSSKWLVKINLLSLIGGIVVRFLKWESVIGAILLWLLLKNISWLKYCF